MGKSREEKGAAGALRSKTGTLDAPTSSGTALPSPSSCTTTQSTSIARPIIINLTLPAGSASMLRIKPTISQGTTLGDHSVLNFTAHPNTPLNLDLPGISISVFQAPESEEIPTHWPPAPTAVDAMSECSTNADDSITKTPRPAAKPTSSQSPPGATNEHAPATAPSPPKLSAAEPNESVAEFYWRYLRPRTPPTHPAGEPAHLYTQPASKEIYHRSCQLPLGISGRHCWTLRAVIRDRPNG